MGPSSDVIVLDPSALPSFLSVSTKECYLQVAVVCLLVYDTILTFDMELTLSKAKYFWKAPRKLVSIVYFTNRYIGIMGAIANLLGGIPLALYFPQRQLNITKDFCHGQVQYRYHGLWTSSLAFSLIMMSIDYILVVRVLALYSQAKTLARLLWTLFALEIALCFAFFLYFDVFINVTITTASTADSPSIHHCWNLDTRTGAVGMIDWLIPMAYAIMLMVLAIHKASQYWKISAGFSDLTLIKVLIVDQIIYFGLVISCCVCNILNNEVHIENAFAGMLVATLGNPFLLSVLGSRTSINLKEAGDRGQNEGTTYKVTSQVPSDVEFAEFSQSLESGRD